MKNFLGLLIVSSGLLLGSFVPMQESAIAQPACPNISGRWARLFDDVIWNFSQSGCNLQGTFSNYATSHTISGVFYDDRTADLIINRTNLSTNCQTEMYATLTRLSLTNRIRVNIYATDGKCELPANYNEDYGYKSL
ncbi:hypothetical protein NIES4072_71620 [Nostoc commune NIES-4072]|uniref:Uncharacterized protein n=1 Tax=Nostoc commune NIES-4072 TaxID=2005467 RepID=A0A2R5FXK5_NOSCO|nr:hypothetical protein [Nostoc commune]BBD70796.1 hypothetical protein NIES4070_72070 [Nostoc commune HK-02]GBG23450.1 hypothetical protein NIES4072_71620 [Nostoc commune NIES-4072]